MKRISSHIDEANDLLQKMGDIIEGARTAPFSTKASIDKNVLFDVIYDLEVVLKSMRDDLPRELEQAERIIVEKKAHVEEARADAKMITSAAEAQARKLVDEHEIVLLAKQAADEIVENANAEAADYKHGAMQYAQEVFEDLEKVLQDNFDSQFARFRELEEFYRENLSTLHKNIEMVRGRTDR